MTDKRDLTPAEDSIPLRLVVYLMTMTCIVASCIFIKTTWPVIVLSCALASIGSVVSYQYRHNKQGWMQWVVVVGVLAVGVNAAAEFMDPANGASDFWGPIVHFVAGTFALHTFDLKSRADINISALLGAIILCFLSPIVRSVFFGLAVFNYICLGTVMLYFDCMSRTLHNWLQKPMDPAPVVDVANITGRRKPRGSVYFTIALLPVISILAFLFVPRGDNLVDTIVSGIKHIDVAALLKMLPGQQPMPSIDVPRSDYVPPGKKTSFKKKPHELENQDEVDKKLREMGVDKNRPKQEKTKPKEEKPKPAPKKPEAKKAPDLTPDGRIKNGRPKDNKMGQDFLDLDTDPPDAKTLLYKITATRLFYSRRQVFDDFDGQKWHRSKDKIKVTDIDVKEEGAVKPAEQATGENTAITESDEKVQEEADKELQQEKLAELAKRETGFGPDMNVDYVFNDPPKGDFKINKTSALRMPAQLPSISLSQNYEVMADVDSIFPSAWIGQDLSFKGKKIYVDDYGQIVNSEVLKKGAKFNVTSQFPVYNLQAMRQAPLIPKEREDQIRTDLSNYLEVPEDLSPEVEEMANTYAGKTGNWFAVAERICMQTRSAAVFEIDKPIGYVPAKDRVKDFLIDRKAGNDKDFATAYVLMCRIVGLPARLVYGFTPGLFNKATGTQDVKMTDAATWAEVYIPDYGWVAFDAVPGGVMPDIKRAEEFGFWSVLKWLCSMLGIPLDDEGWTPKKILALTSIGISLLFLIAGAVLGIILYLRWRKAQQLKNPWQDAAWRIWIDLAKDFKKARMERMPNETPFEFVDRINKIVQDQRREGAMTGYELPTALKEFFITYEAVHFGGKEGLPTLKDQAQELKKLVKANKGSEKTAEAASKAVRGGRR